MKLSNMMNCMNDFINSYQVQVSPRSPVPHSCVPAQSDMAKSTLDQRSMANFGGERDLRDSQASALHQP